MCGSPPLCPAGHLPHRWGDRLVETFRPIKGCGWSEEQASSRSPSLWGRCPAGQRGVSPTHKPLHQKYSPTKSTPYPKNRKTLKNPPALFSTARESPAQSPRSALGYTARRCGEAGPALVVKGYANLHHRGLVAISPVVREKGQRRFRIGWRNPSTVRIGPLCLGPQTFEGCGVGSRRSGASATGCTDSSSASGRTRP